ncbi:MAG: hypothetical protein IPP07_02660 [Holophagales bacterium]|nr:hypothetical protein [Holophagales bacterium]
MRNVYAAEGGERPETDGRAGAVAAQSASASGDGRDAGGARKTGADAGGSRFATAHAAHACSGCGMNGAWFG